MAKIRKMLAFLLVLTMIFSLGEGLALASPGEGVAPPSGTEVTEPSGEPEATPPEASDEPEATPEQSEEPEATPAEPTEEPEESPEPSDEPETPPESSEEPEGSPEPSDDPDASPEPSEEPEESPEPSEEPHKQWPWTEPGNDVVDLMGGGRTLTSGGTVYFSEGGLYINAGGGDVLLASVDATNLNLADGWLYYTANGSIWRMSAGGGSAESVYAPASAVSQMYVMGQEIRYLAGGSLFSYDMTDGAEEALECPAGTVKFIPTPYGNLFFTGSLFNYTLWAEQTQLAGGISNAWTEDGWLVVEVSGSTKMTSLSGLFEGVYSLQEYSLNSGIATVAYASEEAELAKEAAYLESAEYAAIQAMQPRSSSGIMTIADSITTKPLNSNQINIVQRAQQHAQFQWTCLLDRYSWGGNDTSYTTSHHNQWNTGNADVKDISNSNSVGKFLANHTYRGVPYSQAVSTGYVGWGISLRGFRDAVNNKDNVFYKNYSTWSKTAPYYGSDCSGFVSYAWDLDMRQTCTGLVNPVYAKLVGNSVSQVKVGDALINTSSHAMLVTYVGYDASGSICSVEITEQTPPKMKVTMYGKPVAGRKDDSTQDLSSLTTYYLQAGYYIYERVFNRSVSATEDVVGISTPAAPTISIQPAGPGKASVTLSHTDKNATIYYTVGGGSETKYNGAAFTVTSTDANKTITAYATVNGQKGFTLEETIKVSSTEPKLALSGASGTTGVYLSEGTYYVDGKKDLTLLSPSGGQLYYTVGDGDTAPADPTLDNKAEGNKITIPAKKCVIKVFVSDAGYVPSQVYTFKVDVSAMHTIKIDDPYGLVQPDGFTDIGPEVYVVDGKTVKFKVLKKNAAGYTLSKVTLDDQEVTGTGDTIPIEIKDVKGDHTIKTTVELPYTDLNNKQTGKPEWYQDAVAFTHATGLMNGTDRDKFSPTYGTSRAMFVAVLGRYAKYYDSQHPGSHAAELLVSTSSSTTEYLKAEELNDTSRVGITNGYDINVRSTAATNVSNILTTLEAAGQMVHVVGSRTGVNDKYIWYLIQYSGTYNNTSFNQGYVCQTNPTNGKELLRVCNFNDIASQNVAYCNPWVQWAYVNGIASGVSSASFGSTNGISRQDICVMLYNFLTNVMGKSLSTDKTKLNNLSDKAKVSTYAADEVAAILNTGLLNAVNGAFQPTAITPRAQVAQIFLNLDNYLNGR